MKIREVNENKKQFIALLLLADEQENMIDHYLEKGTMYVPVSYTHLDVYKRQTSRFIVKKDMPKEKIKRNYVIQIFRKRISEY